MKRNIVLVLSYILVAISILIGIYGLSMGNLETQTQHLARMTLILSLGLGAIVLVISSNDMNQ